MRFAIIILAVALAGQVSAKDKSRVPQSGPSERFVKVPMICKIGKVKFKRDKARRTTAVFYSMECVPQPKLLLRTKIIRNVFSELHSARECGIKPFRIGVCYDD